MTKHIFTRHEAIDLLKIDNTVPSYICNANHKCHCVKQSLSFPLLIDGHMAMMKQVAINMK